MITHQSSGAAQKQRDKAAKRKAESNFLTERADFVLVCDALATRPALVQRFKEDLEQRGAYFFASANGECAPFLRQDTHPPRTPEQLAIT